MLIRENIVDKRLLSAINNCIKLNNKPATRKVPVSLAIREKVCEDSPGIDSA